MFIPVLLFFFTFCVYLLTHCASFNINDSGETIMVCDLLTISHSPGYPLHTLWGRVNCLLPLGQPMLRVTFSSILTGTISVVMVYWALKMMLKAIFSPTDASGSVAAEGSGPASRNQPGPWIWEMPALCGALLFAFSFQHWFQTCGAKGGIYTLNTLLTASMVFLFFKMKENGWFIKSFLLMGFLYGLSLAHHWPNQIVMAPAYFWFLITHQKKVPLSDLYQWVFHPFFSIGLGGLFTISFLMKWMFSSSAPEGLVFGVAMVELVLTLVTFGVLAATVIRFLGWLFLLGCLFACGLAVMFSLIAFDYLIPIQVLVMVVGVVLVSAILIHVFSLANYIRSFVLLLLSLSVYMYLPIRAALDPAVNWWNPQNYHRLFGTVMREGYKGIGDIRSWTTIMRNVKRFWFHAQDQFGEVATFMIFAMALWGFLWLCSKKQWRYAIGFYLLGTGVFKGVILFNNPLEGYQWTLDNFFSPVFLVVSLFAAAGIAGISEWAASRWAQDARSWVPRSLGAFFLCFALAPAVLNYKVNDQSRYVSSYDEGLNMLKTVNDDGVILCNGDIDILPLWYLQFVLGKRPSVASFTMQLIPYEWYRDPFFKRYPFLFTPVGANAQPEVVVQDMINRHAQERSFYFTNIYPAPWVRKKNNALPDGLLWRMTDTKGLNYAFNTARLNALWSTYRIRSMDPPDRGYWDEYTDVMKDSYGIGFDFTGLYSLMYQMPDIALWSYNNALKFRQPQTLYNIYMMMGETYMGLGNPSAAVNYYQESLKPNPKNPYVYAKLGYAFMMLGDYTNAETAFHYSQNMNPDQKEAKEGLEALAKVQRGISGNRK
jgi:tetratricopeptide (TPR) repeat protein